MTRGGERTREEEKGKRQEVLTRSSWQAHQAGVCQVQCRYCREALGLAPRPKKES